jgi:polar amino acid transport system substrate-binding protein
VAAGYIAKTVGFGIEFDVVGTVVGARYGIAVAASDVELRDALARALSSLMADGTYAALLEEWGLTHAGLAGPASNRG